MRCAQPTPGPASETVAALTACIPVLRGHRVRLRATAVSDFDAYCDIICTDQGRHLGPLIGPEDAWYDFISLSANWALHGHGGWAVETGTGDVAGFVMIGLEPGDLEPELGYLFRKTFEGKNFAFEAASLALAYAQSELSLPSLVSYIAPENTRSIALAKRLGAIKDGALDACDIYRHPLDADGSPEAYA